MKYPEPTITDPSTLEVDSEVTITVTGRVVFGNKTGLVVEYIRDNGFPDRVAVHTAPGVAIAPAAAVDADEIAARQDAHWRVAEATPDHETRARALLSVPYRSSLSSDRAEAVAAAEVTVRASHQ